MTTAADWPQWRGPDRNGVAPDSPPLADAWPSGGPKLLWQIGPVMGGGRVTGHSSPVVAAGRVYLYGNWLDGKAPGGACDAVVCLNTRSGVMLWREVFPADREGEVRCQGSTPCVVDGRVYVAGRKKAYCLDANTGKLVWQQPVDAPHDGLGCSFAVVDGVAILVSHGFYGFDALTGRVRWRREEAAGHWNKEGQWGAYPSPMCWLHEGKNYVVCCYRSVELMDPATGQALWKLPWVEGGWSSWNGNSSPAIIGDQMVLMQKRGGMEGYALSMHGPRKLWHVPDHDVAASPLVYQGSVYTLGGGDYGKSTSFRCVDLQTGRINWERRTQPQGCSSLVAADGKIFGYLQFGKLLGMWKADPDQYAPLAMTAVKSDGYSSLAFSDGHLFVRLLDGVACYDVTRAGNLGDPNVAARVLKFHRELADKEDEYGQLRMGERYLAGDGVEKDVAKARDLLGKAAAQGNKDAATILQTLSSDATRVVGTPGPGVRSR